MTAEQRRLDESNARTKHWKRWGPYLSERAWGTVREDYSPHGTAWEYFPHDHARSRAYRWNEDGIAGICDRHQYVCFALALWNGRDPILKERIFGLTGNEGNHGEDVKEYYFYLDSTPTHSYMKFLYKYPQREFPYADLVNENRRRGRQDPEYELLDTGIFDQDRYFDVFVEYAKANVEDILIRITVANRGPEPARLRLLPTVWFRNTWSWGYEEPRPMLKAHEGLEGSAIELLDPAYGQRWLYCEASNQLLFTENETNFHRLFGINNASPYVKDGINDYIVHGQRDAVNPELVGTKAAADYDLLLSPGQSRAIRLRLTDRQAATPSLAFGPEFDQTFEQRQREADEFYAGVIPQDLTPDAKNVMRQAFAGMLWSKQFYHYVVEQWLDGDPAFPPPPPERKDGRNHNWTHLYNADVISMPDKWEYPVVRVLGPGVPLPAAGAGGLRLRQRATHPAAARVVHAPQRAASRLRVGLRRRQSAGARLGGVAGVQDREEAPRQGRPRLPGARLPQAAVELHLVGQPQGRRRHEHLPGRLSRARQHRRVRPQRQAACRRPSRTIRRHQLDGNVLR